MNAPHSPAAARSETERGLLFGVTAYLLWGLFPIYLKALGGVPPGEVLSHRIVWSLLFVGALITALGRWPAVRATCANRRVLAVLLATALLIAINWLVYIHAVMTGRMLAGSLGYYLNPLVSVGLGVVVLHERLSRMQMAAIALALGGVAVLAVGAGSAIWISVTLALSFSAYGLLRKMAPVDPLTGLAVETAMLAPVACGYLAWRASAGVSSFGGGGSIDMLLLISGAVTAIPLLLFSAAAKRLRYSTVGILQFIAPTIVFVLAVFAYDEPLTSAHLVCFGAIWTAVAIWIAEGWRGSGRGTSPAAAVIEADARPVR